MTFNFTAAQIAACIPRNREPAEWYKCMASVLPKYHINSVNRVAGFISQCAYESSDFNVLSENLNYSAAGLEKTFSKYFSRAGVNASSYARNPQRIANRVYANRMGNGNEASGDGWKYRGRGIIQLTGFNNYRDFAKSIDMTVDETIRYVETKQGAMESACWFWQTRNINIPADARNVERMTALVNGGTHGLEGRRQIFNLALRVLSTNRTQTESQAPTDSRSRPSTTPSTTGTTLQRGSKGEEVRRLQAYLGITADGDFGPMTESALRRWQSFNNIPVTGIATPATLKRIFG